MRSQEEIKARLEKIKWRLKDARDNVDFGLLILEAGTLKWVLGEDVFGGYLPEGEEVK